MSYKQVLSSQYENFLWANMQNLLCLTKTDFHFLFQTPHFVRSACLTARNLFQGALKQICGVSNRVEEITLNPYGLALTSMFFKEISTMLDSPCSPAPI